MTKISPTTKELKSSNITSKSKEGPRVEDEKVDEVLEDCAGIKKLSGTEYLKARHGYLAHIKYNIPHRLEEVLKLLPK